MKNTIEIKTYESGRFTVKLNGKRTALKHFSIENGFVTPRDTEIIFDGRKLGYVGDCHEVFDAVMVFSDENGNGKARKNMDDLIWSLAKDGTSDVSRFVTKISNDNKVRFLRGKIEVESKPINAEYVYTNGGELVNPVDVFSFLPNFDDEDEDADELIDESEITTVEVPTPANVAEPELTFAQKQAAAVLDYLNGATPEFVFDEVTNEKTPRLVCHYEFGGELEVGTGTRVIEFFTDEHSYILDHVTIITNESDGNFKSKTFNFNPPIPQDREPENANTPTNDKDRDELNALVKDATIAIAANYLQSERDRHVKELGKLDSYKNLGLLTADEADAERDELNGKLKDIDAKIVALKTDNASEPPKNAVVDDEPQGWIVPTEVPARKLSDLEIADLLTDRLYKVTNKGFLGGNYMNLTLQNGKKKIATSIRTAVVEPNWHGNGFVFITPWNEVYARYDTAEKAAIVIELIKWAIKRGDKEFTYPANEPPKPATPTKPTDAEIPAPVETPAPPVNNQARAIDLDVYHVDSNLTEGELADYTNKLREALTANGNKGIVTCEERLITAIGNGGGDNKRLAELLEEMCERGCTVEVVDDEADERSEMTGEEFDALIALGTPAPVTIEVPTPEFAFNVARFNDDFIKQRDELKAKFNAAQDALIVAQDNFDDAENALRKFFNKTAYELCNDFRQAQATLGDKTIKIERISGSRSIISAESDIYIDVHIDTFAFVDGINKEIACYDTPAQVTAVINKFTVAIQNGDKLFIFPTVEELNA